MGLRSWPPATSVCLSGSCSPAASFFFSSRRRHTRYWRDWSSDVCSSDLPFMVSGGLTAANVAEAVGVTRAGGVDVSSGVEQAPGVKDPEMIHAFIRAARATEELMVR